MNMTDAAHLQAITIALSVTPAGAVTTALERLPVNSGIRSSLKPRS
jgi:hypothetical protein